MGVEVNFLAVLLAGIAATALGFLWYSPFLLGKPWMRERGLTPESIKASAAGVQKFYALSFVASLVTAFVLSHVMTLSQSYYNYSELQTGLTTAFWMWIGFMFPVQLTATIFGEKRNFKLLGIDTGYQLASLIVMAVVLALL
jgi:hypothetical protein